MKKIIILDFGSQYTQLIARRIREHNVYCEILPYNSKFELNETVKGVILGGSPCSVNDVDAPQIDLQNLLGKIPVLGICYGAQLMAKMLGGEVAKSASREYGRAFLRIADEHIHLHELHHTQVWMSHGDSILKLPETFEIKGTTDHIPVAFYQSKQGVYNQPVWGVQFHPEVTHSEKGKEFIGQFLFDLCKCKGDWTPDAYIDSTVDSLKKQIGNDEVILALSGGVDSTVAAVLLHKAIGKNLHCVFVDNGLLRKGEYEQVLKTYETMGLNIVGVDASKDFYAKLNNESDPERKRKAIGVTFIEVFEREAKRLTNAKWLAQGTIYPDVIESVSVHGGPSQTIKSHHNVGGLPEKLNLKIVEPLRMLFKDEVRRVGRSLQIDENILGRHPFPGPGLAIRIIGAITEEKIKMLQEADAIYIDILKQTGWYNKIWQAGAILTSVQTVGVMGDERTYEFVLALRAVTSVDGMTADFVHLPHEILGQISNTIINRVKGINRVVYDISSKPPATIEWE
ncbi:MAG: glutamine-hydrolyzing synthase [Bacteroidota bacterium]